MSRKSNLVRLLAAFAAVCTLGYASQSANAAMYLVDFTANPGTFVNIKIAMPLGLGTKNQNMTLSGPMQATLDTTANTFQINSADLSASNINLNFAAFLNLATLNLSTSGVKIGMSGPALPISGTTVDLGGTTMDLDEGTLTAVGGGLADSVNENIDLSVDPVSFAIPSPTNATLNVIDPISPNITLAVPINVVEVLDLEGNQVTITLAGTLNFTAQNSVLVPEPSSVFLAGISALGLCWAGRRRFRRVAA